jgi:hypothetical protein
MVRWLARLVPPPASGDPRDVIRWVRRMEIVAGVCLIAAAALLDVAWARWALVACGLLSLSPWPGAARILRRAESRPGVLISDPERRQARGRRAVLSLVPLQIVIAFGVGYLIDGWPAAIFVGAVASVGALGGVWFYKRWAKT